ncbi:hypothetical protein BX070DRAFT_228589, partial [Coemansia spiralis]
MVVCALTVDPCVHVSVCLWSSFLPQPRGQSCISDSGYASLYQLHCCTIVDMLPCSTLIANDRRLWSDWFVVLRLLRCVHLCG